MNNRICEAGVTAAPAYNKATACGGEPTQLATVTIPAYQGGDGPNDPFKPTLGAWQNTIVFYAKNQAVYLYDVNGVFTNLTGTDWGTQIANAMEQISSLSTQLDDLTTKLDSEITNLQSAQTAQANSITALANQVTTDNTNLSNAIANLTSELTSTSADVQGLSAGLATETTNRSEADATLQSNLDTEVADRASAVTELQAQITANADSISALEAATGGEASPLTKYVIYTLDTSTDVSTVNLDVTGGALNETTTQTQSVALPVASETQAGVLNASMYTTLQNVATAIDVVLGGTVEIKELPAEPTQEELTTAWETAANKDALINQATIYDSTNGKLWTYYANTDTWVSRPAGDGSVSVTIATNNSLGIVKGSTEAGQVAVEADGTMSLNGYDGLSSGVATNTSAIETIQGTIGTISTTLARLDNGAGVELEA